MTPEERIAEFKVRLVALQQELGVDIVVGTQSRQLGHVVQVEPVIDFVSSQNWSGHASALASYLPETGAGE